VVAPRRAAAAPHRRDRLGYADRSDGPARVDSASVQARTGAPRRGRSSPTAASRAPSVIAS